MNDSALTPERILDAAEEVLRRYGPVKATVVDVARFLEVSHGTIYRHFPSKAALRDAVAQRWLHRVSAPLAIIAQEQGSAAERLHRWFQQLMTLKRQKILDDPELFATYSAIAQQAQGVVQAHVNELVSQIAIIIESGISRQEFKVTDAHEAAKAIFDATVRFHHPAHAAEWSNPDIKTNFASVWRFILAGLMIRE
ncbi:TetR family transcriptional regulator [Aetokthonos hydrillicola Thurmond2011]|uniref:TetR family transcriptional regulator n=1 Tax=Aetokthonos hydrillicola Thurmond2011 TaxID=2712845 RepID=A0AAP5I9C6_9CYAN|nr:TetR family transcriptional regulator [Aetokthonos hydrillicola]MBO3458635.1 TetR/AcrR family transcriptional regulator [Aetokthonos hydrillicola CCALA 1050]MBW4587988.1 TetR family transcriptional regulator [Aetokthonos hydrillicola CCALA 1050]MDR9897059.1 TetR family transcriptional regulator [Aetokthonos hydrillicola Thurmond2011]